MVSYPRRRSYEQVSIKGHIFDAEKSLHKKVFDKRFSFYCRSKNLRHTQCHAAASDEKLAETQLPGFEIAVS